MSGETAIRDQEDDHQGKVSDRTSRIDEFYGSVTPRNKPEDWRKVREEVEELVGQEVAAEGM